MVILRVGWSEFFVHFRWGWWFELLIPASKPYFSERYGYRKPRVKLFGFRVFVSGRNKKQPAKFDVLKGGKT